MVLANSDRIPRAPPYSGVDPTATCLSLTGPLPFIARLSSPLQLDSCIIVVKVVLHAIDPTTPMLQRHNAWHNTGLGYSRFARRYSGNRFFFLFLRLLRCFSSPGSPPAAMNSLQSTTPYRSRLWWVSPFGHPRVKARLAARRGLSQPTTSFIASWHLGIHRTPLIA